MIAHSKSSSRVGSPGKKPRGHRIWGESLVACEAYLSQAETVTIPFCFLVTVCEVVRKDWISGKWP